jgi:hypothetical protein
MRLATALVASVALHLVFVAIPGRLPLAQPPNNSTESLSVALPDARPQQKSQSLPPGTLTEDQSLKPRNEAVAETGDRPSESTEGDTDESSWFGIPLPRYYEPKELTERARPLLDIVIDSPTVDAYSGAGKIVLMLYINEEGKVDNVEVLSSDIDASAVQASIVEQFRQSRFSAGKLNGLPVKSKKKIEVVIKPPLVITPESAAPLPRPAKGN